MALILASATVAADSAIVASLIASFAGAATIAGDSSGSGTLIADTYGSATVQGDSSITAALSAVVPASASVAASSSISATAVELFAAQSQVQGDSTVQAALSGVVYASATVQGSSTMSNPRLIEVYHLSPMPTIGVTPMVSYPGFSGSVYSSFGAGVAFENQPHLTLYSRLPGACLQLQGSGEVPLNGQLPGRQGSLQINFVTGAAGAARGLLYLVGNTPSSDVPVTGFLGLALDNQNRLSAVVADAASTLIAASDVVAIGNSTAAEVRLSWDAAHGTVQLLVNGTPATWAASPTGAWDAWLPVSARMGWCGFSPALGEFNGQIKNVQFARV